MNLRMAVQAADAENQLCPIRASTGPGPRASAPVEFPVDMTTEATTHATATHHLVALLA